MGGWCRTHSNPVVAFGSGASSNPILWIHAVARCLKKINETIK